jgi:uncharacterized protein
MIELKFEWDDDKARSNERKHGIAFVEATSIFGDPAAVFVYDGERSWEEDRFIMIGMSECDRILTVIYVERVELTMRIISARHATRRERRQYEEKADR